MALKVFIKVWYKTLSSMCLFGHPFSPFILYLFLHIQTFLLRFSFVECHVFLPNILPQCPQITLPEKGLSNVACLVYIHHTFQQILASSPFQAALFPTLLYLLWLDGFLLHSIEELHHYSIPSS